MKQFHHLHRSTQVLAEMLEKIEIRDPMRSLFKPSLRAVDLPGSLGHTTAQVQFVLQVPDRDGGHVREILTRRSVPREIISGPTDAERYALLTEFVRNVLFDFMQHEVDESIWYCGKRVFEPHPEDAAFGNEDA